MPLNTSLTVRHRRVADLAGLGDGAVNRTLGHLGYISAHLHSGLDHAVHRASGDRAYIGADGCGMFDERSHGSDLFGGSNGVESRQAVNDAVLERPGSRLNGHSLANC